MKNSIAITLIVTIGVFGFLSGYSIGFKNAGSKEIVSKSAVSRNVSATESKAVSGGYGAPAGATEKSADSGALAGGYGAPAGPAEKSSDSGAVTGGYGAPAPGYGQ